MRLAAAATVLLFLLAAAQDDQCPLDVPRLAAPFADACAKRAQEAAAVLEGAIAVVRDQHTLSAEKVDAALTALGERLASVETRVERTEVRRETQHAALLREIKMVASKVEGRLEVAERDAAVRGAAADTALHEALASVNGAARTLDASVRRVDAQRDADAANTKKQLEEAAAGVIERMTTLLSGVEGRLEAAQRGQDAAAKVAATMDLTLAAVQNMKRGLKEDLFKCGRALSLELVVLNSGTYFFSPNISNWFRAKSFCEENDMKLALISDEQQLQEVDLAAPNHNAWYWVSGSDNGNDAGDFHWSDGTVVDKELWDKGQPSSYGPGYQTCVFLYTENAKLGDYRCSNKEFFICQLGPECFHKN